MARVSGRWDRVSHNFRRMRSTFSGVLELRDESVSGSGVRLRPPPPRRNYADLGVRLEVFGNRTGCLKCR